MTTSINHSLDNFVAQWQQFQQQQSIELRIEHDPDWLSPAEKGATDEQGQIAWQPTIQSAENNLSALTDGLGVVPNAELENYYCRYFSDNLDACTPRGNLQLLLPWNQDDFIRLQQNLIAHLMMKQRLRQEATLFFALTDEEDFILSVLNSTGEVVLEQVGKEPQETLAGSLSEFVAQLSPANYKSFA